MVHSAALYTGRIHAMPNCCECGAPSELTLILQRESILYDINPII